jgi:hypothetical protein
MTRKPQRWGPALFRAIALENAKPKKERESANKKRARKKAKAPSAKEKSANSRFFLPPILEVRFQSPKPLGRGKSKGPE